MINVTLADILLNFRPFNFIFNKDNHRSKEHFMTFSLLHDVHDRMKNDFDLFHSREFDHVMTVYNEGS
jgi:hypothetical protein